VAHENIQKARLVPQFDPPAKPGKPAAGGKRRPKPGAA
jgi:hypothetical protein